MQLVATVHATQQVVACPYLSVGPCICVHTDLNVGPCAFYIAWVGALGSNNGADHLVLDGAGVVLLLTLLGGYPNVQPNVFQLTRGELLQIVVSPTARQHTRAWPHSTTINEMGPQACCTQ